MQQLEHFWKNVPFNRTSGAAQQGTAVTLGLVLDHYHSPSQVSKLCLSGNAVRIKGQGIPGSTTWNSQRSSSKDVSSYLFIPLIEWGRPIISPQGLGPELADKPYVDQSANPLRISSMKILPPSLLPHLGRPKQKSLNPGKGGREQKEQLLGASWLPFTAPSLSVYFLLLMAPQNWMATVMTYSCPTALKDKLQLSADRSGVVKTEKKRSNNTAPWEWWRRWGCACE